MSLKSYSILALLLLIMIASACDDNDRNGRSAAGTQGAEANLAITGSNGDCHLWPAKLSSTVWIPDSTYNIFIAIGNLNNFSDPTGDSTTAANTRTLLAEILQELQQNAVFARNEAMFQMFVTDCKAEPVDLANSDCKGIQFAANSFHFDIHFEQEDRTISTTFVPNAVVVLHEQIPEDSSKDCATVVGRTTVISKAIVNITIDGQINPKKLGESGLGRVLMHEIGHGFGLPDEYEGSKLYWEKVPLMYSDPNKCKEKTQNKGWYTESLADLICLPYTSEDNGVTYYRSESGDDVMGNTIIRDSDDDMLVPEFGPEDWQVIRCYLQALSARGGGMNTPEAPYVFAPEDYVSHIPREPVSDIENIQCDEIQPSVFDSDDGTIATGGTIFESASTVNTVLTFKFAPNFIETQSLTVQGVFPFLNNGGTWQTTVSFDSGRQLYQTNVQNPRIAHVYGDSSADTLHDTIIVDEPFVFVKSEQQTELIPLESFLPPFIPNLQSAPDWQHLEVRDIVNDRRISSALISPDLPDSIQLSPELPFVWPIAGGNMKVVLLEDPTAPHWGGIFEAEMENDGSVIIPVIVEDPTQIADTVAHLETFDSTISSVLIDDVYQIDEVESWLKDKEFNSNFVSIDYHRAGVLGTDRLGDSHTSSMVVVVPKGYSPDVESWERRYIEGLVDGSNRISLSPDASRGIFLCGDADCASPLSAIIINETELDADGTLAMLSSASKVIVFNESSANSIRSASAVGERLEITIIADQPTMIDTIRSGIVDRGDPSLFAAGYKSRGETLEFNADFVELTNIEEFVRLSEHIER